jgi:hypothetical protein
MTNHEEYLTKKYLLLSPGDTTLCECNHSLPCDIRIWDHINTLRYHILLAKIKRTTQHCYELVNLFILRAVF